MDIRARIKALSEKLLEYQYHYYVLARPLVSDSEYDRMLDTLTELEKKHPELTLPNSPTKRVGSDLDNSFPEREHSAPVLSLDKEYTAEGISKWAEKISSASNCGFVVEEKLDGASIVLYYRQGMLETALTRGDGFRGNVVTDNVRTIGQVPLILPERVDIAVRGEIFINRTQFDHYNRQFENKYSNPRNLAAGSLRNLRSSTVAEIPLNMFAYEGYNGEGQNHIEILARLRRLNFPVNLNIAFFSDDLKQIRDMKNLIPELITGPLQDIPGYIRHKAEERTRLDHEIDGLVFKVNELALREKLGETSHHPRWALAFKFDSPAAGTILEDIVIQVGRNGRVSPVALLKPVRIAGSLVSRATLHNQEYIDILELGKGDTVSISKRGDVIPAVEEVIMKNPDEPSVYRIREDCPFCGTRFIREGAHHFCPNTLCPERMKRAIVFFTARGQMDIETLGEKTIEFLFDRGFIREIPDIYRFDFNRLLGMDGFKEKKIENIRKSVEKSRGNDFATVFVSLGLEGIGTFAVRELIRNGFASFERIRKAAEARNPDVFSSIPGFGEITARLLIRHFTDRDKLRIIDGLAAAGLKMSAEKKELPETGQIFTGETWVITGSFLHFNPRSLAAAEIEKRGGKVTAAVSAKTSRVLAGEGAGSKLSAAKDLGIPVITEDEFIRLLK